MTPAWITTDWPQVQISALSTPKLHLVHLGTSIQPHGMDGQHHAGQTLWGCRAAPSPIARLWWHWVELAHGVVAMVDPLGLATNLQLVGPHGETLSGLQTALYLNELVHTLPWQHEVARVLQAEQSLYAAPH